MKKIKQDNVLPSSKISLTNLDDFVNTLDWISVTNDFISFDEMLFYLDKNNISFTQKHSYENHYVVIDKNSYKNFIPLLFGNNSLRITRFDLKFDYLIPYRQLFDRFGSEWEPSSCVGKKDEIQTIYFNSRQSDIFCRFYNKTVESNLDFDVSRLEFEIKGSVAKQFSLRLSYIGFDDAVNYIVSYIQEFSFRKNIDSLLRLEGFGDYLPFEIIEKATKVEKFRRFLRQYSSSILTYLFSFDLTPQEFVDLCNGTLDFEKYICR